MQRREFIIDVGAAAVWPLAADAQQPPMPVIGFLSTRSASDSARLVKAFGKGLEEAGFSEGKNISVDYRFADGRLEPVGGNGGWSGSPASGRAGECGWRELGGGGKDRYFNHSGSYS